MQRLCLCWLSLATKLSSTSRTVLVVDDALAVEALRELAVGVDAVVSVLGLTSVLVGSGCEIGVADELNRGLDYVCAVNRIVRVCCLRCRGGRRGRRGGCDGCRRAHGGGRGGYTQVADGVVVEVDMCAGEVVDEGVAVLPLVLALLNTWRMRSCRLR